MNPLYNHLVKNNTKTISDHELSRWPTEQVDLLKDEKLLKKGKIGKSIYCDSCIEYCPIYDYDIIEVPDKGQKAAFVCPEKDEMGFQAVSLSRRRQWIFMGYIEKLEKTPKETKKLLNVRVGSIVIKHPKANSDEIAKLVGSTDGSVRTTDAWKMRKQLRQRYDTKKGWKDSEGSMDAYSEEIQAEHWDIYNMFQDYKSGENPDYPSIERIAEKLKVKEARAKELLKQAKSMLEFEADKVD